MKVEISSCNVKPDAVGIDGGGILHSAVMLYWPKEGLVCEFIDGVTSYIFKIPKDADVYLAVDRYVVINLVFYFFLHIYQEYLEKDKRF